MKAKICSECKIDKPLDDFSINKAKPDGRNGKCKKCHVIYVKQHYLRNPKTYKDAVKRRQIKIKEFVKEYKSKKICIICGESRWWVLEFHHRNPSEKEVALSNIHLKGWSEKKNKEELEKCDILCANCHRDLHYKDKIAEW